MMLSIGWRQMILEQYNQLMISGMQRRHFATKFVIHFRHPKTSPIYVIRKRHPISSSENVIHLHHQICIILFLPDFQSFKTLMVYHSIIPIIESISLNLPIIDSISRKVPHT